jgi:hypothetical protein
MGVTRQQHPTMLTTIITISSFRAARFGSHACYILILDAALLAGFLTFLLHIHATLGMACDTFCSIIFRKKRRLEMGSMILCTSIYTTAGMDLRSTSSPALLGLLGFEICVF